MLLVRIIQALLVTHSEVFLSPCEGTVRLRAGHIGPVVWVESTDPEADIQRALDHFERRCKNYSIQRTVEPVVATWPSMYHWPVRTDR
ncbi:MAG: hypothetical protein KatS3mg082_3379 [Nitrospiraceae bacterium]|nr:MAG: hypothetical protein KatS3mg051_1844 [Anaerolineae bacterium]GIW56975.1 MAG: hypothetical protein KatS3mg082_3379 [Nitrospiraceae bacterium]